MVIQKSSVGMNSDRSFSSSIHVESETMTMTAEQAATLELSKESESYVTQMRKSKQEMERGERENANQGGIAMGIFSSGGTSKARGIFVKSDQEMKIALIRKILQGLMKNKNCRFYNESPLFSLFRDNGSEESQDRLAAAMAEGGSKSGVMMKTTAVSSFIAEKETTQFSAEGQVKTTDGRSISFNVDIEMSREFYAHNQELLKEKYILIDPLVINYEGDIAEVSDQKFLFDLNSDGASEEISFVGEGSGFLAIDKNGDGKINDGNELFGTKTGNGFIDLSAYDEDGNGWIDEADKAFGDLKIWTKDSEGNDRLLNLKEAGVGALYLQSARTEFTQKNVESGEVNGVVRRTGVFLKENGDVGTLQHIDLAI